MPEKRPRCTNRGCDPAAQIFPALLI